MSAMSILDERSRYEGPAVEPAEATDGDWPGRWLGGAVGVVASLGAAILLLLVEPGDGHRPTWIVGSSAWVALLGIPIAFALGRAAFPSIRRGGWGWAVGAGVLIGLAAPPLGAFEILFGPFLVPLDPTNTEQLGLIAILPIAVVFAYVVIWITIPVGVVTAVAIRAVPRDLPARLRAPEPLARLGVAHAIGVLTVLAIAVQVVGAIARG